MSRDQLIARAKVILDPVMGAMRVDNADQYDGLNACLIEFGNPEGRVARVRQDAGYDETRMLAWGKRAVDERGGNCDDFAAAVCYLLHHNGYFAHIEHVQAPGHAFVVINRDVTKGINETSSWTGNTFIIDYWLDCRVGTKRVETVYVPADLLCDIPAHTVTATVSSQSAIVNHYVTDMSTQPGSWYAGHRANKKLQSMTRVTPQSLI